MDIAVSGGEITVRGTDAQSELALSDREAALLLFGCNRFAVPQAVRARAPEGWFPLPFCIPEPDSF